jgi:hypothetical protein
MAPELPSIWHFSRLPGSLTQSTDRLPAPSSNPDISALKTPPATLMAKQTMPRLKEYKQRKAAQNAAAQVT